MSSFPLPRSTHFSARDFFKDSPWLNVPPHRKADILIEPLYPRFGLLGGSSAEKPGKMSKLAALAAARKKKEQKSPEDGLVGGLTDEGNKPISLRDRLAGVGKSKISPGSRPLTLARSLSRTPNKESPQAAKDAKAVSQIASKEPHKEHAQRQDAAVPESVDKLAAGPSDFAAIISGEKDTLDATTSNVPPRAYNLFTFVVRDLTEVYNFAEPSPDDIVIKAQSAAEG